jgi:hypothetical protein
MNERGFGMKILGNNKKEALSLIARAQGIYQGLTERQ